MSLPTKQNKKMSKYIVKGSVRGTISSHRTIFGAFLSMRKDQKACASLGGGAYSDVEIEREDGSDLTSDETDEIETLQDQERYA